MPNEISNVREIRELAKMFLELPVKKDKLLPPEICVHHPFISSSYVQAGKGVIDIIKHPKGLEVYKKHMRQTIDKANVNEIFILLRTPYRLVFLKQCYAYLSEKDLAELFADAWISTENPNQDPNCSISFLIRMFQRCKKEYLMTEEDYKVYQSLPETFTVYRGVAIGRNPGGISWTQNLETAKWFSQRFDNDNEKGYILTATINKKDVLAYFNSRGKDEVVCNIKKMMVKILPESVYSEE
jgi:hypothetical protein